MKVEFYEGWVQNQWGHKLLFCLLELSSCLRTVCCYYAVASFCSSFYSTYGRLKEWISAVYLIKHATNIHPSVFNTFHMTLIHGESHKIFARPPFFIGTLQWPCHTPFFRFRKNSFFWRQDHFFLTIEVSPKCACSLMQFPQFQPSSVPVKSLQTSFLITTSNISRCLNWSNKFWCLKRASILNLSTIVN